MTERSGDVAVEPYRSYQIGLGPVRGVRGAQQTIRAPLTEGLAAFQPQVVWLRGAKVLSVAIESGAAWTLEPRSQEFRQRVADLVAADAGRPMEPVDPLVFEARLDGPPATQSIQLVIEALIDGTIGGCLLGLGKPLAGDAA